MSDLGRRCAQTCCTLAVGLAPAGSWTAGLRSPGDLVRPSIVSARMTAQAAGMAFTHALDRGEHGGALGVRLRIVAIGGDGVGKLGGSAGRPACAIEHSWFDRPCTLLVWARMDLSRRCDAMKCHCKQQGGMRAPTIRAVVGCGGCGTGPPGTGQFCARFMWQVSDTQPHVRCEAHWLVPVRSALGRWALGPSGRGRLLSHTVRSWCWGRQSHPPASAGMIRCDNGAPRVRCHGL